MYFSLILQSDMNSQNPSTVPSPIRESWTEPHSATTGFSMMSNNQNNLLSDVLHELEERAEEFNLDEETNFSISVSYDPMRDRTYWDDFDMNIEDQDPKDIKEERV